MWNIIMIVNSVLLAIATFFLIFSAGAALILGDWKQLLLAALLFLFLCISQVAIAALNM